MNRLDDWWNIAISLKAAAGYPSLSRRSSLAGKRNFTLTNQIVVQRDDRNPSPRIHFLQILISRDGQVSSALVDAGEES
jgi:hypothetical protein